MRAANEEMTVRILERIRLNGKISVAEVRDMFKTNRRIAVALLQYLDKQGITRHVEFTHVVFGQQNLLRKNDKTTAD